MRDNFARPGFTLYENGVVVAFLLDDLETANRIVECLNYDQQERHYRLHSLADGDSVIFTNLLMSYKLDFIQVKDEVLGYYHVTVGALVQMKLMRLWEEWG